MSGTPQDGTVRHRVVDPRGRQVEAEAVGTTSVHEVTKAEPKTDGEDKPARTPRHAKK